MRWIASLTLLLALAGGALAAGTDDQYLEIYNQILQADSLLQGSHQEAAAIKYRDALDALQKLHQTQPSWNASVVDFRLQYLAEKVKALAQYLPSANPPTATTAPATKPTPQQLEASWQEQIAALTAANAELSQKLKEALSVQPAAVAPGELAKMEEKNLILQKERDLLNAALDEQKAAKSAAVQPPPAKPESPKLAGELAALKARSAEEAKQAQTQIATLKLQAADAQKTLADANTELNNLKAHPVADASSAESIKQLTAERDRLKKDLMGSNEELASTSAALEKLKSRQASEAVAAENTKQLTAERDGLKKDMARASKDLAEREAQASAASAKANSDAAKLKQMEQEKDELAKQVAALSRPAPVPKATAGGGSSAETAQLRARLAVLEAAPVPYTAQELAVLNTASATLAAPPAAVPAVAHKAHSLKDLPPGAGPLMAEAMRAVMAHDYAEAEKKYLEVLRQDEQNVYVLVNLGNAQFALGHLEDCEKNVQHALTLDPADPGALYLMGILRYRQDRLDEALDALSRSAALNSTNSMTQNYLGVVLAGKGLRPAAETALRKSLELDQFNSEAHFNLALVYASEKPPSLALARWHYQKSVEEGHPKSSDLEKMLADEK